MYAWPAERAWLRNHGVGSIYFWSILVDPSATANAHCNDILSMNMEDLLQNNSTKLLWSVYHIAWVEISSVRYSR